IIHGDNNCMSAGRISEDMTSSRKPISSANSQPAMMPGIISGSWTRRKVCHVLAPATDAASRIVGETALAEVLIFCVTIGKNRQAYPSISTQPVPYGVTGNHGAFQSRMNPTAMTIPGTVSGATAKKSVARALVLRFLSVIKVTASPNSTAIVAPANPRIAELVSASRAELLLSTMPKYSNVRLSKPGGSERNIVIEPRTIEKYGMSTDTVKMPATTLHAQNFALVWRAIV